MSVVGIIRMFAPTLACTQRRYSRGFTPPPLPRRSRELREQVVHGVGLLLELRTEALARKRDALRFRRLQQIVDGAMLEGADRVLVVGGDEHDVHLSGERFGRLDAIQSGHLDVEEDDVRLLALHERDRFAAVALPRRRSRARATLP